MESTKLLLILFFGTENVVKYYLSVQKKKAETKSDTVYAFREPIPGSTDYNLEDLPQHQPRNTANGDVSLIHSRATTAHNIKIEEQNHFTSNNNTLFKYINAHKQDTRYIFEKEDHEVIPIKGPLTEL